MKARFMVGVYGTFCPHQLENVLRPYFAGLEVSWLSSTQQAGAAAAYAAQRGLTLGIHFPLVRTTSGRHPRLTSPDPGERDAALAAVGVALREATGLGASYLVVHFPKPALLKGGLDWSDWRFTQEDEATSAEGVRWEAQAGLASQVFSGLDRMSQATGIRVVVEHDILHPEYYRRLLPWVLAAYPGVGFCVDTGRLHLLEVTDPGFSATEFLVQVKKHVTNVHLWTVRAGTNVASGGHHPLLPRLDRAPGWGDMGSYLRILASVPEAYVVFEHDPGLVTPEELDQCYDWVRRSLVPSRTQTEHPGS
ncbi:MAG: hypothetical protein AB1445_14630 [Bacillota bacterium]